MSTKYSLVDPAYLSEIEYFQEEARRAREQYIETLESINVSERLQECKDDFLDDVRMCRELSPFSPDNDDMVVGVFTAGAFKWRNGFSGLGAVQKYMEQHPELRLYDEYGSEIAWPEFEKIATAA
jgi:hypothetical protein